MEMIIAGSVTPRSTPQGRWGSLRRSGDNSRSKVQNVRRHSLVLRYTIHMKRTNLVLDPHLLEEAIRVFGAKTYSAAVNAALKEVLRVRHIQSLPEFFGSGLWEGSLAEMREDRTQKQRPLKRRSHR